jgi:hypothetical protein
MTNLGWMGLCGGQFVQLFIINLDFGVPSKGSFFEIGGPGPASELACRKNP